MKMWLYVWNKEVKDLYVGNKKVVGAYVWKELVWPVTKTEVYTPTPSNPTYYTQVDHSWWKIQQVIIELSATNNNTNQYNWLYFCKIQKGNPIWWYDYGVALNTWLDWGVFQSGYGNQYWSTFSDYSFSESKRWLMFPSSATTSSAWACRVTITDWTTKVEVWRVFWTWLYTNTYTQSTQENEYVKWVFNDQYLNYYIHKATNAISWEHKITVTYTK